MFEDDAILPDDFEADTTPDEAIDTETPEPTAEPESTPEPTEPTEESAPFLELKYNKEIMGVDKDRAIELAQMGMNYPKLQEKLQALEGDPRLSFVEQLAGQHGMNVQDYIAAVNQQQEQSRIQELVEKGISEELAQEMLENRKFREQFEAEKKAKADQERQNADYNDFFDYFKQANGRDFNSNQDAIPESVWQATQNGVPLKFAYMMHENQQLRNQIQTHKQNESNAKKAPIGSTTAHGGNEIAGEDDFLAGFNSI